MSISSDRSATNRNIQRGEGLFNDPNTFNPERYLVPVDEETAKRLDPKNYCFGFGRRVRLAYLFCTSLPITLAPQICPGRHLVHSSAWILMASFLATMNITKAVDANGKQIEPEIKYDNSIFRWGERAISPALV